MDPVICLSAFDISAIFFVITVVTGSVTFTHMAVHFNRRRKESQARIAANLISASGVFDERALQNSMCRMAWATGVVAGAFVVGGLAVGVAIILNALAGLS